MSPKMSEKLGKIGLKLVVEEIDNALALYPEKAQKQIFASPNFRQLLIDYVASRIIREYLMANDGQDSQILPKFPYHSLELRLKVEIFVHRGIRHFFPDQSALMVSATSVEKQPSYMIDFAMPCI
ncbi:MAG: hypothetical protein WA919_21830 [Coleofasciculaceae cyanobacterium]